MEVKKEAIKPNAVYAVQYVIDTQKYHGRNGRQRGLIVTDVNGVIYKSWNMCRPDKWADGPIELFKKHKIYEANEMEVQFAWVAAGYETYRTRCHKMSEANEEMRLKVRYYEKSKLHKIAEWVRNIFKK